jgi:D-psicose/D-tagatose/L-ribulose 3-epimerase
VKLSFLFYDPIPDAAELARRMGRLAELGYQGIELSAAHPPPVPVEEVAKLAREHRMPVVSLLSGWSYSNEGLCLSRPDPEVRKRAVQRLISYAGDAAKLGAVLVVGLMQGRASDEPDENAAGERIAECLRTVARSAQERGGQVVIEPVNHMLVGFHHTAAEVAALVDRVGSPALGYMLDTAHMHVEERSVPETIRKYGGRCRHFHLCETNGGPFGTGGLDFPAVLEALTESGYEGFVSVKVYRKASWEEAAAGAVSFLRRLGMR